MKKLDFKLKSLIFLLIGAVLLVACGSSTSEPSQENVLNSVENAGITDTDSGTGSMDDGQNGDDGIAPTPTKIWV